VSNGVVHKWEPSHRLQRLMAKYDMQIMPFQTVQQAIDARPEMTVRTRNVLRLHYYWRGEVTFDDSFALFISHLRRPFNYSNPLRAIRQFGVGTYRELRTIFQDYL
jgi:hypothetical protein